MFYVKSTKVCLVRRSSTITFPNSDTLLYKCFQCINFKTQVFQCYSSKNKKEPISQQCRSIKSWATVHGQAWVTANQTEVWLFPSQSPPKGNAARDSDFNYCKLAVGSVHMLLWLGRWLGPLISCACMCVCICRLSRCVVHKFDKYQIL